MKPAVSAAWCVACALLVSAPLSAQIADQVIVYGQSNSVLRFDRRLTLLGETVLQPISGGVGESSRPAIDGQGRIWIPFDPLSQEQVVRMLPDGTLLPSVTIQHNPLGLVAAVDGRIFGLTRIPLSSPGPVYAFDANGDVLWSNAAGPSLYTLSYPQRHTITTTGALWIGGTTPLPGKFWAQTLLTRLQLGQGAVAKIYVPPDLTADTGDEYMPDLVAALDGTLWMSRGGPADGEVWYTLERTDGESILQSIPLTSAGNSGFTAAVRVDGAGKLYVASGGDSVGLGGSLLYRYDPASPTSPEATYKMGGLIRGFALGANGDEAYAVISNLLPELKWRLERVNLVTGRKSSVNLDPWFNPTIPYGDPTGFNYANIIDRSGDNDGDGIANGVETAARSNPFDALSRPEGPKVHIDFVPTNNAIILIYQDPDGLLDPQGGLDLSTLSVTIGNFGNVFWFLLPFATALDLSADGTQATLTLGALPLPLNKKWPVEARVADLTGAVGWDWQVTPPGDL